MKNKTDTSGKIYVKCPVESNDSAVMGVWTSPLETVEWNYFYTNGEKKCYGYTLKPIIPNKRGIKDLNDN